ncbi:MAG: VanZ family protein [Erysipelotrichia bacterium]|nr:VanZ family protein [Erysipelotrichia bacterium]
MSYISIVKAAFIAFPLVAAIVTVPFVLVEYHKYGSVNKLRTLIIYSFILYMITVYFLVILPLSDIEDVRNLTTPTTQLIPFKFIYDFISNTPLKLNDFSTYIPALKHPSFYTVFFNILMTVPFGMYLNYYYKCDLKKVIKYSFILSLFFELTQLSGLYFIYPRPYRLFDVDDLIMNTLGGICGYFLMNKLNHLLPTRDEIDEKSFNDGLKISGLKRLVLFFLDGLICSVFITFVMMFFNYSFVKYIVIFIYYIVVPLLNNDQTLGSKFLNIKFVASKYK